MRHKIIAQKPDAIIAADSVDGALTTASEYDAMKAAETAALDRAEVVRGVAHLHVEGEVDITSLMKSGYLMAPIVVAYLYDSQQVAVGCSPDSEADLLSTFKKLGIPASGLSKEITLTPSYAEMLVREL